MNLRVAVVLAVCLMFGSVGSGCRMGGARGPTDAEQAEIRNQVEQVMQGFIESVNHADLKAVLASLAEVPEFRYAHSRGKLYDLADATRVLTEDFKTYQSAVHDVPQTSVLVLASDSVHYVWNGSSTYVLKDGTVMRAPAFTYSFVFRRFASGWKMVYIQETIGSVEPVKTVETPEKGK